jgi:hypothetical protein
MPSRRDVLRLGGSALPLFVGCVGPPAGDAAPSESTAETSRSTQTAEPTQTADVRLREVTVTPSLVALNSPDSIGTFGDRDRQFVVAGVGARGRLPFDRAAFELATEETTYAPTTARQVTSYGMLWGHGDPYEPETGGYLLFRVPNPLDADSVALRWPDGERSLSEDALRRLRRPPTTFAVREFAAPASVTTGSEVTLTLTVENVGDADGTFVAGLNRTGPEIAYAPVEAVSLDAAAGESTTWTHSYTPTVPAPDEDLSFDFVMHWCGGDERATVGVEPRE